MQSMRVAVVSLCTILAVSPALANGVFPNGVGSRSAALAGANIADATALGALAGNPAGLAWLASRSLDLSVTGLGAGGRFENGSNANGRMEGRAGVLPGVAYALPAGPHAMRIGLAVIPEAAMVANWRYVDAPGGWGGVTYGMQEHRSKIVVVRTAAGVALPVSPRLSLGGTVGVVYNQNGLKAPYVFQSQPTLKGAKTLLDLNTSGYGFCATLGATYQPRKDLALGLAYRTPTRVRSHGDASGNAQAQFDTVGVPFRPDFHYDAQVLTKFPQTVTLGGAWQAQPRTRLHLQTDWINWANAFDELPVSLTNGNNADINGFVGSSSLRDVVPLGWKNRVVWRGGVDYAYSDQLSIRAGYAHGRSPVPDGTITPMTAVLMEHSLAAGFGYQRGRYTWDVDSQLDLPSERRVASSSLQSGEYDNSLTRVTLGWVGMTMRVQF